MAATKQELRPRRQTDLSFTYLSGEQHAISLNLLSWYACTGRLLFGN